jgi:GT2 family glycosyltransferase
MAPPADISVIIVTRNSDRVISECLLSLRRVAALCVKEVIVVDNGSLDMTIETIAKLEWPAIRVIRDEDNRGFAAANNQGLRNAAGEWFCLLNPDTIVLPCA